jgi:tRNA(Ile)-lysidine synthase
VSQNLNPHYDSSNDSPEFLRNRLRHTLIPTLETYNPRFREAVWRTAQTLSSDQSLLTDALGSWWKQAVHQETDDYVTLDLTFLSGQTAGLQRRLIRHAIECLLPTQEIAYSVLEGIPAFIANPGSVRMDLIGNLVLLREGEKIYVARAHANLPCDAWPQMPSHVDSLQISLPAKMSLSDGWIFSSEKWQVPDSAWQQSAGNDDPFRVWLDTERFLDKLELRVRRPGDLFEPLGLNGHSQKLSDFFTNVKLPQRARARWPLLCSGDKVIWVPGYRPSDKFKLKTTSKNILYFAIIRPADNQKI